MAFLAPLFLAGLAALSIPIIIHLRRRRERVTVEFPSLMFLRGIPFQSDRRKSIRNPLLLLLRLLALAFLAVAFSRPFLQGDGLAVAGGLGPRELVVLLDRSWSMDYEDRWAEAVDAVEETVAPLGPDDRVSLVLFDDGATAPVRSSPEPARVVRAVQDAQPSDHATRFAPAIRLSRSILETSQLPRREVVLISDFQALGLRGSDDITLPPGVTFTPIPIGSADEPWSNVSIVSVELRRSGSASRDAVLPTARVVRRGEAPGPDSAVAVLEVDGQVRERVAASLEGGAADIEFGSVALTGDPLRATVRIEQDAVTRDDVHHLVISPGEEVSVLVLEPAGARPNASLFIRRALELSREPPVNVEVTTGSSVPADVGDRFDVVVLNDRDADVGALRPFLEDGGGVLWAPGTDGVTGADAFGILLEGIGPVQDHGSGELRLGSVDRNHPVFEPFRESGTGNFTSARFFRTRDLDPADSARVIARFGDGSPALVEGRVGRGRVLIWASTLHTFWTDLPIQSVYLPFVHQAVLHLANRGGAIPSYTVGSVLPSPSEEAVGPGERPYQSELYTTVITPDDERIDLEGRETPIVLDDMGFHELVTGDAVTGLPVAVNVDAEEGDLTRRDVEEMMAAVAPPPVVNDDGEVMDAALAGQLQAEDVERHQGLWRFLLAAAFVFFVGETLLSNRLSGSGASAGRNSGDVDGVRT